MTRCTTSRELWPQGLGSPYKDRNSTTTRIRISHFFRQGNQAVLKDQFQTVALGTSKILLTSRPLNHRLEHPRTKFAARRNCKFVIINSLEFQNNKDAT